MALRGADSEDDERFVKELSAQLGYSLFHTFRGGCAMLPETSRLQAARRGRNFSAASSGSKGSRKSLWRTTNEDRVETFLLHLMRGAGREGWFRWRRSRATRSGP